MKAKLRREISALLKELTIPSKLYRGRKFKAFRGESGRYLRTLKERLTLSKPGTLVGDCDGYNHIVKGLVRYIYNGKPNKPVTGLTSFQNGFYGNPSHKAYLKLLKGYTFVFPQVEFEDGNRSCGCESTPEPPRTREFIEAHSLRYLRYYSDPNNGWPLSLLQEKRLEALERGEHITDERGVLLENFCESWQTVFHKT